MTWSNDPSWKPIFRVIPLFLQLFSLSLPFLPVPYAFTYEVIIHSILPSFYFFPFSFFLFSFFCKNPLIDTRTPLSSFNSLSLSLSVFSSVSYFFYLVCLHACHARWCCYWFHYFVLNGILLTDWWGQLFSCMHAGHLECYVFFLLSYDECIILLNTQQKLSTKATPCLDPCLQRHVSFHLSLFFFSFLPELILNCWLHVWLRLFLDKNNLHFKKYKT